MNIPPFSQRLSRLNQDAPVVEARHPAHSRTNPNQSPATQVSFSSSRQAALELFERTLAMGYEKLQARQGAVAQFTVFEPLTAEKVAGNILGFIEYRLQLDIAEGATLEQLQSRLEAGLAGFEKGFADASEKLKALSMLSPEIEQDIGNTYDLVISGIDALREKFLGALIDADNS